LLSGADLPSVFVLQLSKENRVLHEKILSKLVILSKVIKKHTANKHARQKNRHTKMPGKNIQLGKRYEKHMTKYQLANLVEMWRPRQRLTAP
jgi:hypothetical protein